MVYFFPLLIHSEIYFMNFSNSMKKTFSYLVYSITNNIVEGKPINNPNVPPTDPIMLIKSWIKYSSKTFVSFFAKA